MSRLAWTTELPTSAGAYWVADVSADKRKITMETIWDDESGKLYVDHADYGDSMRVDLYVDRIQRRWDRPTVYWYGPLTPPALTPPGGGT